jgi:predicted Zn finger-like uncharacterized protein
MIVKCKKCEKKLKVSDDKLTEEGIKVKCPGCSTILLVKKPVEKVPETTQEEAITEPPSEEPPAEEEAPAEEEFSLSEEGGFELPEETPAEEEAPAEEEFSLSEEGGFELPEETPAEEEPPAEEEAPAEEEPPAEEEVPAEEEIQTEGEDLLEGFDDGFTAAEEEGGLVEEKAPAEEVTEEFQLDTDFDFSGEPEEAGEELKSNLDLAGDVAPGEEGEEGEEDMDLGPSLSLRDEPEEAKPAESPEAAPPFAPDASSDMGEPPSQSQPQPQSPRRKPTAQKEVTGFGVAQRRSIPVIIPIILIVAVIGAGYFVYKKITMGQQEDVGELTIYDESDSFVENVKEGKLFIISGKVKNGYKVDRSFIQVKGTLFDDEENEIVSRTVYAGNIPTKLETKKLSITELDKLSNRKMGEELSNMNVAPETSIGFKIIFPGVDEESVTHYKVIGAGSELAYSQL